MPNEQALKLAETILDDFRGAGYYADPKELAQYLNGAAGRSDINEGMAIEIFRGLLRVYGQSQDVKERFAAQLEPFIRN
jgi:hypothetical protein